MTDTKKFTLEIDLGPGIETPREVAYALENIARELFPSWKDVREWGDGSQYGGVFNDEWKQVGTWKIQ